MITSFILLSHTAYTDLKERKIKNYTILLLTLSNLYYAYQHNLLSIVYKTTPIIILLLYSIYFLSIKLLGQTLLPEGDLKLMLALSFHPIYFSLIMLFLIPISLIVLLKDKLSPIKRPYATLVFTSSIPSTLIMFFYPFANVFMFL